MATIFNNLRLTFEGFDMDFKNSEQVKKLIEGCKKGDRKSQKIVYEALYPKMLGVCMRYSKDQNHAQDLVHDGFIKVFDKIKSFDFKGSLEGWIRRLIVNNTIDKLRKDKQMQYNFGEESYIENLKDKYYEEAEEEKILRLKAEKIVELIQRLSPIYKTVFNLYVIEELSHKEIAEKLNISVGTSKSNLAKAKLRLKELYNEHNEEYE